MQTRCLIVFALAAAACQNPATSVTATSGPTALSALASGHHHANIQPSTAPPPAWQLELVKRATRRYRDMQAALDDQYVDIGVVLPNMGRHLLKNALLDGTFEVERPELLVYSSDTNELVAVEYAVPLPLSATAPEGFDGAGDQWFPNQTFNLWTLHAWVWKQNPDGIFNPTNRRVP